MQTAYRLFYNKQITGPKYLNMHTDTYAIFIRDSFFFSYFFFYDMRFSHEIVILFSLGLFLLILLASLLFFFLFDFMFWWVGRCVLMCVWCAYACCWWFHLSHHIHCYCCWFVTIILILFAISLHFAHIFTWFYIKFFGVDEFLSRFS